LTSNYQSFYHTNTRILEATDPWSGYVSKDGMVAAVPSNGKKFVVIHGGNILKTCRNYQSALKLCKKLEKQTSRTTGTGTLPL
tara:strand:- start:118 stop:366 length:249 start_codon:yes stop_codon:yes gene_type:complete